MPKCGAVAYWLSMRTHNTGVVSPIPLCVTFKTPYARKTTGNHLMNPTPKKILRALSSVSATLKVKYATQKLLVQALKRFIALPSFSVLAQVWILAPLTEANYSNDNDSNFFKLHSFIKYYKSLKDRSHLKVTGI